jgi:hypothetical protein
LKINNVLLEKKILFLEFSLKQNNIYFLKKLIFFVERKKIHRFFLDRYGARENERKRFHLKKNPTRCI